MRARSDGSRAASESPSSISPPSPESRSSSGAPAQPATRRTPLAVNAEDFWSKVDRSGGPSACWPWTGYRVPKGYGQVHAGRAKMLAHIIAAHLAGLFGRRTFSDDERIEVMHIECDNPPCCNPGHLCVGTHAENMRDMATKGRGANGARNFNAKLDAEKVRTMRELAASGVRVRPIARRFGVTDRTAKLAIVRITWRHVA